MSRPEECQVTKAPDKACDVTEPKNRCTANVLKFGTFKKAYSKSEKQPARMHRLIHSNGVNGIAEISKFNTPWHTKMITM